MGSYKHFTMWLTLAVLIALIPARPFQIGSKSRRLHCLAHPCPPHCPYSCPSPSPCPSHCPYSCPSPSPCLPLGPSNARSQGSGIGSVRIWIGCRSLRTSHLHEFRSTRRSSPRSYLLVRDVCLALFASFWPRLFPWVGLPLLDNASCHEGAEEAGTNAGKCLSQIA